MNKVNIIMAAYNGEKYIKDQIESILHNSFKNWVLWIFDDGSKDQTELIIEKYIQQYPQKIRYYRNNTNKGVTRNFLEGVKFVTLQNRQDEDAKNHSQYYMFCDQDDVWMGEKIHKTLKQMKKAEKKYGSEKPVAVFTDAIVVDEKLNIQQSSFYKTSNLNTGQRDLAHMLMENKLIGCTVMFNEALTEKLDVIPKNARYHDWWIALIASAFGHITYLKEGTLLYRQHGNNVVGNQSFLSYVKNRFINLHKQKEILDITIRQAREFYNIFEKELTGNKKELVYGFAYIKKNSWFMRRKLILEKGYLKTGIIRNIGLLLII
ncbi:glycosyltransferase family 2 protein [Anaerocolumna sp.]|uniref:glycosyltransferase family 2 protein n=1 Tax=Anaerocolumna sp. TaxID=2041569 RepID=UPI0028AA5931|nr:glycosyltransferase family 2 protein [Anaerocolumna sp.]